MYRNNGQIGLRTAAAAALIAVSAGLGACSSDQVHDYRGHSDRVTSGAGNAPAANMAMHTVDPWPYYSQKTDLDMDGKRAQLAAKRYETNTSIKPKGLGSSSDSGNGNGNGNGAK
jgi:hypothetical protein